MKKRYVKSMFLTVLCGVSVAVAQLPAPLLNSPVNNTANVEFTNGYVNIQWMWVAGASYMMVYQAQIATDTNFASHFVCDSTFRHMPHVIGVQMTNLAKNTTYFWRVRASDTAAESQWSPWSAVWKFTTAASTSLTPERSAKASAAGRIEIRAAGSKLLLRNAAVGDIMRFYNINGSLLLSRTIASTEETIIVPAAMKIPGKSIVVTVKNDRQLAVKAVLLP